MTTRPQDYFGASPKTVLNKPFFHAQDQKAYNADGGSVIADTWTRRLFNTVIYNDTGLTLNTGTGEVSAPAGTYRIKCQASFLSESTVASAKVIAVYKDGVKSNLQSPSINTQFTGSGTVVATVEGDITLTVPGTIDIRYFAGTARATDGFGTSNNAGSITDASISSIYADLKIWQLDRSLEIAPKAINSGLQTISGMNTEGNMMGFDVTVSGNTLTITKGSCMSSDLTAVLAFTANKTCVLPGTVNGDFYVFAVRLLDGVTFEARAYSTYAGPSSDAQIDKWRLVSFAKNNASGVTMPYVQNGDRIDWLVLSNRPVLTASVTASYVSYNLGGVLPVTQFKEVTLAQSTSGSSANAFNGSYDGTADISIGVVQMLSISAVSAIYLKSGTSSAIHTSSATLRR